MPGARFELAHPKILDLKSSALDHSAIRAREVLHVLLDLCAPYTSAVALVPFLGIYTTPDHGRECPLVNCTGICTWDVRYGFPYCKVVTPFFFCKNLHPIVVQFEYLSGCRRPANAMAVRSRAVVISRTATTTNSDTTSIIILFPRMSNSVLYTIASPQQ